MKKNIPLKITPFSLDVTPPVGFALAYGANKNIHSPIYIRGLAVTDGKTIAAVAACDFLFVAEKAISRWKKTIADVLGTIPTNVFIHSVHQHDSVSAFPSLGPLVDKYIGMNNFPQDYFDRITKDLECAVRKSARVWMDVENIAVSEERMHGLASNRRLLGPDGKIKAMRWSSSDEELQKEPVGLIDPMLRTIAFLGKKDKVLAAMHYYATHPQSVIRRFVTSDVPGAALRYVSKNSDPDTHHIYFTGCGANVTFGKYNLADQKKNPPDKRILALGEKLGKGIIANLQRLEKKNIGPIRLKHSSFEIPLAKYVSNPSIETLEKKILKDIKNTPEEARTPMTVMWPFGIYIELKRNWKKLCKPCLSMLNIGNDISIMSLPSETVVEYQLYAQSLVPEKFLACAAYGDASYMYIPTAAMYKEKGYEPAASVTTKGVEKVYKDAIKELLQ